MYRLEVTLRFCHSGTPERLHGSYCMYVTAFQ